MKITGYIFVLLSVFSQTISTVFGKTAALSGTGIDRYLNHWYLLSLTMLGIQALVWQQALKRLPLSIAYPMMSLIFVFIPLVSYFIFLEKISSLQILGLMFILAGTIRIAGKENI